MALAKLTPRSSPRSLTVLTVAAIAILLLGSSLVVFSQPRGETSSVERALPTNAARTSAPPETGLTAPYGWVHPGGSTFPAVSSTLDLVDNRTLPGDQQPASQDTPQSVVYDPANGDLYVRGYTGESLTVVNGSSNAVVAEIAVPESQNPEGLSSAPTIVPVGGSVYVANEGPSSNISIIDGTTNKVSGSITVAGSPDAITDDPALGELFVAIWTLHEVEVVNTTHNSVVTTIPVGSDPYAMLYDPAAEQVFVANWGSQNVSVIDPSHNRVIANITTGTDPVALALDTHDDYVDVANDYNGGKGTVTIIPAPASSSTHGSNVTVGNDPDALAYVASPDQLFVANGGTANVSVIDQSSGLVVANPAVGEAPTAAVYDPTGHDVYVLNSESPSFNITILDPATDKSVGNVSIDNYFAYGLAVDTGNGNVVAVSEGSFLEAGPPPHAQPNATIVSGSTNRAIASVPLDVYPEGMTFDPFLNALIVADPGGNDTYVVNATSGLIGGIRPAALEPERSAFDSLNNELYVLDDNDSFPYEGEVTILNPQLQEVTNLTMSNSIPSGIAFDSANGKFYVSDEYSGDVWVFNGSTNKFNTTIPLAASHNLASVLYDPHNQDLYVGDSTSSEVYVINGTKDTVMGTVHVGLEPSTLAFDSENNTIFVGNSGSGNVSVIDDASNTLVKTFTLADPGAFAYDPANNLLFNAESFAGAVLAINASTYLSAGPAISLGSTVYPHGITYDPQNQFLYVSTEFQGSISIIPAATYNVTFVESGLTPGTSWSVTLAGTENSSATTTVGFDEPNGDYPFTVGSVTGYTSNVTTGSVPVSGHDRTVEVGFTPVTTSYAVTFVETGLPASSLWNVTLGGVQNHSTTTSIGFSEVSGTYSFSVGTYTGYVANNSSGTVHVTTSPVSVDIGFTALSSTFPVTFVESGLPGSTLWNVTFHGGTNSSTTSSIGFRAPNGKWPFTVGAVSGFVANATSGNVTVASAPQTVLIGFTAVSLYPVNFTEQGLPLFTHWTLHFGTSQIGTSDSSILFDEPSGTYDWSVGAVTGYSASPSSGSAHVLGAPYYQNITFTAGSSALSVRLVADPATISLGATSVLTTTTSGGSPPFSYEYADLPMGCSTLNSSSLTCTPTQSGTFSVLVAVTQASGSPVVASTTLNVTAASSSGGSPANSTGSWLWIVLAVVLAVVVALVVFVFWRRRRGSPPPAATPPPPPGSPPPS